MPYLLKRVINVQRVTCVTNDECRISECGQSYAYYIVMAAATFRFMQDTAKTAMRRVLGIRGYAVDRAKRWYHQQRWQEATRDLYLNSRQPTTPTAANYYTLCFGSLETHSSACSVLATVCSQAIR